MNASNLCQHLGQCLLPLWLVAGAGLGTLDWQSVSLTGLRGAWGERAIAQVPTDRVAQALSHRFTQAERQLDAGEEQYRQGNLREALSHYQAALAIYREPTNAAMENLQRQARKGDVLTLIGLVYARLGQYQSALERLQQAQKTLNAVRDRVAKGKTDTELKLWFSSKGRIRSTLFFLSLVQYRLGNYDEALEQSQNALSMSGRSPADYGFDGELFNHIGKIYLALGQRPRALEAYYRALMIVEQAGYPLGRDVRQARPPSTIEANKLIYGWDLPRGQEQAAFFARSLQPMYHDPVRMQPWARYLYVLTLNNLGDTDYSPMRFYIRALEASRFVEDLELQAITLNNVGRGFSRSGSGKDALAAHQEALQLSRKLGDRALEGKTLHEIGTLFRDMGKLGEAIQKLTAAVELWESLRPGLSDRNLVSLFETQAETYNQLQQALVAQNKPTQALEIAERSRARAFVELLSRRLWDQIPSSTVGLQLAMPPMTIAQIQQLAQQQQTTLVEYSFVADTELYIWVVKPTGAVTFRQVNLQGLLGKQSMEEFIVSIRGEGLGVRGRGVRAATRSPLAAGDRPTIANLQRLHQVLIAPIADQLPTDPMARVTLVPQGALFLVPFGALQDAKGKYLIEQHTLAIAPSIQVLDLTRQLQAENQSRNAKASDRLRPALIVGNPTMPKVVVNAGAPPEQLANLPGAEQEAKTIAALLQTQALTGGAATKAAVVNQMGQARLIHLATHGLMDDFKGLGIPGAIALAPSGEPSVISSLASNRSTGKTNGGIMLSQVGGDGGLLTAADILDLRLNADLVVLSACDTGRGRITGDGVLGLSRSLISAGAPSVIVSLWAVPDAPTASLMTGFYQNLQRNPNKAQALRQAMLTAMEQYPDPRDWAAFALIGAVE